MKQKKLMDVPDSIFEALGFALPKSRQEEYQKGNSITDYVGSGRIVSLKKENTYQKAYPAMNGIGLLNLNYPSMPDNHYEQVSYVLQVIGRYIKNTLMSLQKGDIPGTDTESGALTFMQEILEPFKEELQISRVEQSSEPAAKIACMTFRLPSCYQICLTCMDGEIVYGAVGMKRKRKDGYYFIRGEQFQKAHTIDLTMFLSMAFLIGGIHQIKKSINLPLVQNVFEEYLSEADKVTPREDHNSLAERIRQEVPLSIKEFFRTYESNGREYFCLNAQSQLISDAVQILCKVLEIYRDISYENRHRSEIARSIATAYITKKNIPRSVHSAMENTGFMDYFKFVEFDEEVDLASVRTIEKEFEILNHAYFAGKPFKEVTLRFRKLGKHRASGLYYPTLHTLCVDIRCPSSFIHEYFHMIDDQLGDLSLEVAFNQITALYREEFLRQMEQLDDTVKNTLNGKSKYNIQYFFRRAEIFARCGEIYFTRILKVESSLIAPDLAYAYPKSEELDHEIKNYYEALLNKRLPNYGLKEAV